MASRYDLALGKKRTKAEKEKAVKDTAKKQMAEATTVRSIRVFPDSHTLVDAWTGHRTDNPVGHDQPETREVRRVSPIRR